MDISLTAFIWVVVLTPGLMALGVLLYAGLISRPRVLREPPRDAVILAAHPDDCVILAGEYAVEAARAGRRVEIAYFTCGDHDPRSPRAQTRRREALTAWAEIGVGPQHLHFLELPESPVEGPLVAGSAERSAAQRRIEDIIRCSPPDAVVFIPALGESHVDHAALRQVALKAVLAAGGGRTLLEAPEYNPYYSLRYSPWKSLSYLARSLPLGRRWWAGRLPRVAPAFACGGGEIRLSPDRDRLAMKKTMLRRFASENGDLLVKYFGFPDRYRRIRDPQVALDSVPRAYVRIGSRFLAPSVLMLGFSFPGAILLGLWTLACGVARFVTAHAAVLVGDI